ncbi:uncharacterized protein LOC141532264 isoform X2 [Cotesia typhae]|uniref:uncharacterized protein LOC141532264 isoform X2 n=1 Tax=Cotesia typhae TaxID=2053667 RepID=UPI003D691E73
MNSKKRRRKSAFSQESVDSDFQSTKDNSNPGNNGQSSNSLTNLLEQYNSDSDDQDDTPPENKHRLDDKVNDFFKEIQFITQNTQESQSNDSSKKETNQTSSSKERVSASPWQECFDESTGYPYYWHIETNEVTWELPKELASTRKNSDNIVPQQQLQQHQQPNRLPKLPYDKLPSKAKNDLSVRNKSRHKSGTDSTSSTKRTLPSKKKSKQTFEDKNDDSDDSYIEMITSFGDDNTDTDKSDDEKTADESWTLNKSIKREREREALESTVSNDTRDEENSKESNRESSVNNSIGDQSNEENSFSKKPAAALFPAAVTKSWFVDGNPKVDTTVDQEFSQASDSQDTNDKIEAPKLSRPLENLGTSLKGFQRKRRIAYDVLTIPKNNEDRLGLGFAKTPPIENSSKETAEEKKRNLGKYAIDFIKGETLEVNNEATNPDYFMPNDQVQMIADKLKSLSKECSTVSEIQVMSIKIQALMTAWESGDLKDRYFYNWMADTKKELTLLEEKAAPSEWDYQWDSANKQYFYRNKVSGETQLNYPDINGGAEEMELCTTPPPANSPISEIKSLDAVKDDMTQSKSLSNVDNRSNVNSHTDLEKSDKSSSSASLAGDDNNEDGELAAPLPPRISIPSPPPPPRIGAQDLKKNSKTNKSNNDCLNSGNIEQSEVKNHIIVESIVAPVRETLLTPATQILAASVNTPHIEPLPPGVDQSESPYALAAATLKSPLIFPGNHHQPNAPIFDPTNISILGHHHPALVHNQLVHYPVYHQHLHDQAILAAANRFTGQDAVQLMLHHTGIYANTQVITKPPINMKKESLGSIVDSFYNDIASLECHNNIINDKQIKQVAVPLMKYQESVDKTESTSPNISTTITTAATTTGTGSAPSVSIPAATPANSTAITTTTNSAGVTTTNNPPANAPVDLKDKKKKKVKIVINKKHKQVSSMVAKWKKAQNFEDIH